MNQSLILFPMLALMGWTFCVLLLMGRRRIGAVQAQRVHPREFALGETAAVPADVTIVNRHYMNLLETPQAGVAGGAGALAPCLASSTSQSMKALTSGRDAAPGAVSRK